MYLVSRGSGYPVLFIHGMPTCSSLWNGVMDKLDDGFRCLAVDLPGLGQTPKIPYGPNQLELLANQVEQIRQEHNIEKWHVVGHDAGSAVAIYYAHRFQEHVDHLALLSPAVFPELQPFHLFQWIRVPVLGEILAPFVNAIFWKVAMRMALQDSPSGYDSVIEDFRAPFSGLLGSWRLMSIMRFGDPAEILAAVPEMLPQLAMPTLVFHGAQDRAIPELFAQRVSKLVPHSRFLSVDAGHFIPLHKPDLVASELRHFFFEDDHVRKAPVPALSQ
jgi:pimeloyl-ACP methyl ester carboxylesterase